MTIQWSDDLNTGHKKIDRDHAIIHFILDSLKKDILSHEKADTIKANIDLLSKIARNHVKEEEAIIRKTNILQSAEHEREHQNLKKAIEQLTEEIHSAVSGDLKLRWLFNGPGYQKLFDAINTQLVTHILEWDKKIVP